ncbi:hypothetical protein CIPAW_05G045600 [Carya illinoinensis]|uniref:Uncharacterized protein n=1 Tax=Carya illinoinensis TaxID=32201 RepID=A0A8T1QF61_CARIL|nr:hypothetical protein CIPAW_05G045600 [Carya illinoinensis]
MPSSFYAIESQKSTFVAWFVDFLSSGNDSSCLDPNADLASGRSGPDPKLPPLVIVVVFLSVSLEQNRAPSGVSDSLEQMVRRGSILSFGFRRPWLPPYGLDRVDPIQMA